MASDNGLYRKVGVGAPDVTTAVERGLYSASGKLLHLQLGKLVCVGRNYADHAQELGNSVPSKPLLFMKPAHAVQPLQHERIYIPTQFGACHHELELAVLISAPMRNVSAAKALDYVAGYGLALDLTLRDVQNELKAEGAPWERAKAFDGSAPLGPFVAASVFGNLQKASFQLYKNDQLQQDGKVSDMIFPVAELLAEISTVFTLEPGDVVLTGTPAGVGPLQPGDNLKMQLTSGNQQQWYWHTTVADAAEHKGRSNG